MEELSLSVGKIGSWTDTGFNGEAGSCEESVAVAVDSVEGSADEMTGSLEFDWEVSTVDWTSWAAPVDVWVSGATSVDGWVSWVVSLFILIIYINA